MVSRYHWLTAQNSGFLAGGTIQLLLNQTLVVPAGGILKKILFKQCEIRATQSGTDEKGFNVWNMYETVDITAGPNSPRSIFSATRRIPMAPVAYLQGFVNKWACYYNAGDNELGVDQQCSYGKLTDTTAMSINIQMKLVGLTAAAMNSNFPGNQGEFTCFAKLLYFK